MKRSFTLIELLVAITIIGILAAMSIPNFTLIKAKVLQTRMKATLSLIYKLEQAFYAEHGRYGPGPDGVTYNIVRYYPYTVGEREVIAYPPNNLNLVMPHKYRYYYSIFCANTGSYTYFIARAIASRYWKNDIDGDRGIDYWYVSNRHPDPVPLRNDLQ